MTDRFLTIIIRNPTKEEARELVYHPKLSATSWSHAMDERDEYRHRLQKLLDERRKRLMTPSTTLRDAVSYLLRDVHQDLAYADGPHYQPDFGDPRAVEVLLKFLAKELQSDVHFFDMTRDEREQGFNEGMLYAAQVLRGEESCSLD